MIIGIDIGGTFTDFTAVDANGRIRIHKCLTTPSDPARAVLDGLAALGAPPDAIIVHGSTIATNALLERKGARTALIATRGFADVIEIGRQNRPQLYALEPVKPEPLVPRDLRFEIDERIAADGSVLKPLDVAEVQALIPQLLKAEVESVAVCFLFSFLHPEHEQVVKATLTPTLRHLFISLSSDILPEYREYERTSTTVINAHVAPLIARYLDRLAGGLGDRRLRIMQSNGGVISAATAASQAARTALSGPAGGIVGAFNAARQALTPYPRPLPPLPTL
ncbi:MAG TPA: hydantoinase/oxoprolinase family protein, partial [Anaerolineae bacterium]